MTRIFAYIQHKGGVVDDSAAELAAAARKIDAAAPVTAIVTGSGTELDAVCDSLCASYSEVLKVRSDPLAYPNAEIVRKALLSVLPVGGIILVPHNTFGMDLSPGLSIKMDSAFVSDVVDIEGIQGSALKLVRQEYGGQFSTHVICDISSGAVLNIRPGSFQVEETMVTNGVVIDHVIDAGILTAGRRYLETIAAEMGDVDITKADVLVSIGRGIQEQKNVDIARELADAMGAVVSCSRPIVDAKWMDKSRQVGTTGQTVKPKVYMACGISGSFQHLGGIKGNPFIVAINKNPNAPIFQTADVGVVADILELLPELTNRIREM